MKKFLIIVFLVALLIAGYSYDQFGWAKKLLFGEPTTHVIQRGEFLSKIAKKYYGRADYWRELALINRAPDSDLVFPGEEIIIPSLDVIKEIRRTQWLSKVNSYVKNQEDIIARLKMGEEPVLADNNVVETEPMTTPEQLAADEANNLITPDSEQVYATVDQNQQTMYRENEESQSTSSLGLILTVIGAIFVASLIAIVLIRKRKQSQITIVDDDELNILDEEEESEPDYNEYLKNKSHEKEGVLVS